MARPCSICANRNRNAIEAELGSGAPLRFTARQFQVSASALFRHKEHTAQLPKAPAAVESSQGLDTHSNSPEIEEPGHGLTIKQKLFVEHYLATRNGTLAAGLAGYSGDNHQLSVIASRTLGNASVRAEIDRRIKPLVLSANEVLELLSQQANATMDSLLTDGVLDLDKARENGSIRLIKKLHFDKTSGKITTVELCDIQSALVYLGKRHKLWVDRVETDTPSSSQEELRAKLRAKLMSDAAARYGLTEAEAAEIIDDVFSDIDGENTELSSPLVS